MTPKATRAATWRARLPVVAVVVACVAGVVSAVTGAANPVSAVQFLLPGHWVYNDALGRVFHVDGSTGNVDARAEMPGDSGDQVFQGDTSGYVVGSSRVTEFGRSSLEVETSSTTVSRRRPVGVETAGGPYLVYEQDGKVVRLGDPTLVVSLGGPVGSPVATSDGTLWLSRTSAGLLCRLSAGSKSSSCGITLPKGHAGALTVVGDRVVFVDTTTDRFHVVEKDGLGAGRDLGVDMSDDARLASTDAAGRLVILDGQRLHLVDTADEPAHTVSKNLPEGDYDGPVSTGEVVAVVDKASYTLTTYGIDGQVMETKPLPTDDGDPRITRGEDDRIYVDGEEGGHVVVVDKDGDLTNVPIDEDAGKEAPPRGGSDPDKPPVETPGESPPPATEEPDTRQQQPPVEQQKPPTHQQPPPQVPPTPPGAPAGVSATAGDTSATVSWGTAPDNRAPITGYTISWASGRTTVGPNARTANIGALVNGTGYVFTVTATNAKGTGPGASSNPVTPLAQVRPASMPLNLVATNDFDNSTVTATWAAPADLGTGTFAHYAVNIGGLRSVTAPGTSVTVNGIQVDTALTITVAAITIGSAGEQLTGAQAATTTAARPVPTPVITLSRGPANNEYCPPPNCAWMHIVLTGFPANTDIPLMPHSTDTTYTNPGYTTTTTAEGYEDTDKFAYHDVGETVWVTGTMPDGTVVTSNQLPWEAG